MNIGVVKEIVNNEFRVGLTPTNVAEFINNGHEVFVEKDAGLNSGFDDEEYRENGAVIKETAKEVWEKADLLIKVKEPQNSEYKYFRENQTVFGYLHLAAHKDLTQSLLKAKTNAIAFETVTKSDGSLPCLEPMSIIAGRLSAVLGAQYLMKTKGGSGKLISGIPGVDQAKVSIVGAGNVGVNALKLLVGLGANVTILDVNLSKLSELDALYGNKVTTLFSNSKNLEKSISNSDLVIGAISLKGEKAPKLIKRKYYKNMRKGSVIIDVAIDQGGSTEVSRPTSHDNPTFVVDGIIHYCVPNIPGSVPLTATEGLNNAIMKYALIIANEGIEKAVNKYDEIRTGANIINGEIVNKAVATSLNMVYNGITN